MDSKNAFNENEEHGNLPEHKVGEALDLREVLGNLNAAKEFLKLKFGIDDLSVIEGGHLRHLIEQCMREHGKNRKELMELVNSYEQQADKESAASLDLRTRLERRSLIIFDDPSFEAATRWLFELYGINKYDIPVCDLVKDETSGKGYKFFYPPELSYGEVCAISQSQYELATKSNARQNFLKNRRAELNKKIEELKSAGHRVSVKKAIIEPDFKEYLRRLREESHKP